MVVVGVDFGAVELARLYIEGVPVGVGPGPELAEFCFQGREAIGFLDAQVPHVLDPRGAVGEEGHHRVGEGRVGKGVHVDFAQAAKCAGGAAHGDAIGLADDLAAHLLEQFQDPEIRLQGVGRDAVHAHRTPRDGGGAERVGGRGGVGFDAVGPCPVGEARAHPNAVTAAVGIGFFDPARLGPKIAHDGKGGLHVGARNEFAVEKTEFDVPLRIGGGEQHRRGELAGLATIDAARATGKPAPSGAHRRAALGALDAEIGAQGFQGLDQVDDGPLAHTRVAVDHHRARGQAGGGGEKPRRGARILNVERICGRAEPAAGAHHRPGVAPGVELRPQGGQGVAHDVGVVAGEGAS